MIRLKGGFEQDEYWKEVRETGDDRLKESGFDDWVVTLRPLKETSAVNMSTATKTLEIGVPERLVVSTP